MPASKSFQVQMAAGTTKVINLGPLPQGALLTNITIILPGSLTTQGVTVTAALNQSPITAAADQASATRVIDEGDTIVNGQPQWSLQSLAQVLLTMTVRPLIRISAGPRFVSFVITETTGLNAAALLVEVIYLLANEVATLTEPMRPSAAPPSPFVPAIPPTPSP